MRLLLAAILLLQPAGPPPHQPAPGVQTERFARDLHDKNIDDMMTLFTPKAVFEDPEHHRFIGLDAIRKLNEQVTATYDSDLRLNVTTLEKIDKLAIEHGTWTETLRTRATGATQNASGTYVFLHKRRPDGRWLISQMKWSGPSPH